MTRRCACGGSITAPDEMDSWMAPVLRHVRSARHRRWSLQRSMDPRWRVEALPAMVRRSGGLVPCVSVRRVA